MLRTWPEKSSSSSAAAVLDDQTEIGRAKKFGIQTGPPGFWVLNEIEKDKRIQRSTWAVLLNNHIKSSIIYNTHTHMNLKLAEKQTSIQVVKLLEGAGPDTENDQKPGQ